MESIADRIKNMTQEELEDLTNNTFKAYASLMGIWDGLKVIKPSQKDADYILELESRIQEKDKLIQLNSNTVYSVELVKHSNNIIEKNKALRSALVEKDNNIKTLNDQIEVLKQQLNNIQLNKRFLPDTGHKYNDITDEALIEMIDIGIKPGLIAKQTGMTYHGIRARLIKLDRWEKKTHGGQKKQI